MKLLVVAFRCLARADSGVTGLEYGLLASLMGVVIFASVATVGLQVGNKFTTLTQSFDPARDLPGPTGPPPEGVMANPGSNEPGHASAAAQDTGRPLENEIGGVVWGTGESIAPAASPVAGTGGPVILSAKDLLAAAQGSDLGAAPAAGPREGTEFPGGTGPAAIEKGGGRPSQSRSRETAGPGAAGIGSLEVGPANRRAVDGAARPANGGPTGKDMNAANQPNVPPGSGGGVGGLLGLLAALLGLAMVIWKLIRRAMPYSDKKSQSPKRQRNSEDKQGRRSAGAFSRNLGATA